MNPLRLLLISALIFGSIARIDAQSATDTLKRAGLLPDPRAKPPTISKKEGGLLYGTIAMWQTERGRQTPVPTPTKPIYYVAYDAGLSTAVRGVKIPAPATMGRTLRAALASAGYEPATDENRPSLAIVYRMDFYGGGVSGGGAPSRSPGVSGDLVANDSSSGSSLSFTCQFTVSAYDYDDLTRSTKTLLWVTQSGASDPFLDLEEAYLAFVEACAPYFGALLPEDSPRKVEGRTWVGVPHRDNLTDQTPAFPALSLQPPILDQRALRELEQQERAWDKQINRNEIAPRQAAPARPNAKQPAPVVEISPGVGPRIANYLREKKALEEILAMRTQGVEAGADTDRVLGTFVAENANRISTLTLTGEALRRTILTQATTNTIWRNPNLQDYANGWIEDRAVFDDLKNKPLEAVLLELKSQIRASGRPVPETKTSAKPTSGLLKTEATSGTAENTVSAGAQTGASTLPVVIVSETTERGAAGPWPKPEAPVRYVAFDGGYVETGPGWPKPPPAATVAGSVRLALGSAGFVPATADVPPTVGVIYHWGAMYNSQEFPITPAANGLRTPAAKFAPPTRPTALPTEYSSPSWLTEKATYDPSVRDNSNPFVRSVSSGIGGFYFVVVTAYDFSDLKLGKATPLWRLKLTAGDRSGSMSAVLPTLLNVGSQYIGRAAGWSARLEAPVVKYVGSDGPAPEPAAEVASVGGKVIDDLLADTQAWLRDKRDSSPDDEAFRTAQIAEARHSGVPAALAARIATYQKEKAALQNALATWVKNQPDATNRTVVKTFNESNAARITALERMRENIRADLAGVKSANPNPRGDKSLDDLLREFAGDARHFAPR